MNFSEKCPSTYYLESFLRGDLEDDVFAQIESHLLSCTRCEETARELDRVFDSLISELQTLDAKTVEMTTVVPEDVLERTVSFFSSGTSSENSVVVLDRARQIAQGLNSGPMKLDRFEVRRELGQGSFGHVFLAYDPQLDRTVALKLQHSKDVRLADHALRSLACRCCARL